MSATTHDIEARRGVESGQEARVESNGLDLKVIGLMLFSVTCGVLGQVFFRSGMKDVGHLEFGPQVLLHFLRPVIIGGIICYAVATSSWLVILSKVPLSLAYPMVSISYLAIALLGRFYFHETVSIYTWAGVLLVCSGVVLIGFGNQSTRPTHPPSRPPVTASP